MARSGVVERYLDAIQTHDWDALAACVTDDVVRVGPYADEYKGRADYIAMISGLMPTLPGYAMDVSRVTYDGDRAFAELSETVDVNGATTVTHEVLVLELQSDRIARIDIYIQRGST